MLKELGTDSFPVQNVSATKEEFAERLEKYEEIIEPFSRITVLLGKWANAEQRGTLEKIFNRLPEANSDGAGIIMWLGFRWYPILSLMYTSGIAAISANNYENLKTIFTTIVNSTRGNGKPRELVSIVIDELYNTQSNELFKTLPGYERHHVPRSEYMFKELQFILEDTLCLGASYERLFDRFEVILALAYADLHELTEGVWGPLGRFGWKYKSRSECDNPFADLVAEAKQYGEEWPLLKVGFFQGSLERFNDVATRYETELLQKLTWL